MLTNSGRYFRIVQKRFRDQILAGELESVEASVRLTERAQRASPDSATEVKHDYQCRDNTDEGPQQEDPHALTVLWLDCLTGIFG